jgi:hypothetical protein
MSALQVAANSFGAKHTFVEREILPWLKPDDSVVLHFQLNAALLAAEATVGLDDLIGVAGGIQACARRITPVWAEVFDRLVKRDWFSRHG